MCIEYKVILRNQHGKKKSDIPKSVTDFALKRKNAVVAKSDGTEQIQKIKFFSLNEQRI